MNRFVRIYLVPGAVLQSVNVGGGYGTGRELVEFFGRHGIGNGLLGMAVATSIMAVTFALSLALAQHYRAYDYRSFFQVLLGRAWFLYEIIVVLLILLVLAVIGAAAGEIIKARLGLPSLLGGAALLVLVVLLNFFGRDVLTRTLAAWSLFLYAVFLAYFVATVAQLGPQMRSAPLSFSADGAWLVSALQYALYNISAIPIVLYAARAIETRRQAVAAGLLGGVIVMFPALLFHLSFLGAWPTVVDEALPVYFMFDQLDVPLLSLLYLVVLFGTFIETGAGDIQGLIERLDGWWRDRGRGELGRGVHAAVSAGALALAGVLSTAGVVALIADGYGTLAWAFLAVYLVPLFTIGIRRLRAAPPRTA